MRPVVKERIAEVSFCHIIITAQILWCSFKTIQLTAVLHNVHYCSLSQTVVFTI